MIPVQIQIRNFLSYGPKTQMIPFGTHRLICLSGKNGHGKSALLDAITWAIWGQARKTGGTAKADEGLLRLGQSDMMVCLDFMVKGITYRVKRTYTNAPKSHATVDIGILDASERMQSLSDKTIRATQQVIDSVVGIDYQTFINSAFLRQGQSNEFSQKSPKERKEILGTILGIERFEELRRKALDKQKVYAEKLTVLTSTQERIAQELESVPTLQAVYETIKTRLAQVEEKLSHLAQRYTQLITRKQEILTQRAQKQMLQTHINAKQEEIDRLTQTLLLARTAWKNDHRVLLACPDPQKIATEHTHAQQAVAEQQRICGSYMQLKEQILKATEELHAIHTRLVKEHAQRIEQQRTVCQTLATQTKLHEQSRQEYIKQQHTITAECAEIEKKLAHKKAYEEQLKDIQTRHALLEKQFEKRKQYYHKYTSLGQWTTQELEAITNKQHLMHNEQDPSCPVCEQSISASRKRLINKQLDIQEKKLHHKIKRLKKITITLKGLLHEQHTHLATHKKQEEEITRQLLLLSELEKRKAELTLKNLIQQIAEHEHLIAEYVQRLNTQQAILTNTEKDLPELNTQYISKKAHIAEQEQLLQSLNYVPRIHEQTIAQLREIEKKMEQARNATHLHSKQLERKGIVADLIQRIRITRNTHQQLITQIAGYTTNQLPEIEQQEQTLTHEIQAHTKIKDQELQEIGKHEQKLAALAAQALIYTQQAQDLQRIQAEIEAYDAVAAALSKDGIQALLIEDALPEIEHEANQLLSKLTDNQAHLSIASLRDLKKGGTRETLDITISDALGIRAYELFSGGEAFRIDFALRIALSKLLARRAGTSLQTLIIDEGFGSQDEEGLSRIMDALQKIQDDFEKVIIVSHLSSMKEEFPVHFVIEKGAQGSIVQVIQHA